MKKKKKNSRHNTKRAENGFHNTKKLPIPPSPTPLAQRIFLRYPGCNIRPKRNLRRYCTCGPMLYVMSEGAEVASDPIDMAVLASGSE